MSQEQIFISFQNDNAQMKAEMLQMKQLVEQVNATAVAAGKGCDWHQGQGEWHLGGKGRRGRVFLNENAFVGSHNLMEHLQSLSPGFLI